MLRISLVLIVSMAASCVMGGKLSSHFHDLRELHNWVTVEYDWSGSPWTNRSDAIDKKGFIVENNVITGINSYEERIFVCVPRWRRGVPATLAELVPDPTNASKTLLRAWPSWDWNLNKLDYVQSVFVDQDKGWMYIIDTGRENFFSADPSEVGINRHAKLHVVDIKNPHGEPLYSYTFPNTIFPLNNSFLNDIVVDTERNIAYMTDTNVDPNQGALVMHNLRTNVSRRLVTNATRAQPWYHIRILNVTYPFNSPCDGIALSDDNARLFFSVVEGASLFAIPTDVFRNASTPEAALVASIQNVTQKRSFSDGLRYIAGSDMFSEKGRDIILYGSNDENALYAVSFDRRQGGLNSDPETELLYHSDERMQWLDTFAKVRVNGTHTKVFFTTNRLQRWIVRNLDLNGGEGPNFRVWSFWWKH